MVESISRAELIKRTAANCGIPEAQSKVFFDIFLVLLSNKLSPGDRLFINGTGYFYFNKAVMRGPSKINKEYNVILFSPELKETPSLKDHLLFNIPVLEDQDIYKEPDHHFSLSVGKPVIPLKGSKYSEFTLPPSGPELRHLFYSKAGRLLKESEIIKGFEDPPVIIPFGEKHDAAETIAPPVPHSEEVHPSDPPQPPRSLGGYKPPPVPEIPAAENKPDKPVQKETNEPKFERVRSAAVEKDAEEKVPETPARITRKGVFPDPDTEVNTKNLPPAPKKKVHDVKRQIDDDAEVERSYGKRRSKAGVIVLAGLLILSASSALIYYSPLFQDKPAENITLAGSQVVPVIIERTYDIPVTYPYDKPINLTGFTFDPITIVPEKITEEEAQNPPAVVKQETVNEFHGVIPVKIKDNIYRYNEKFIVQLSSWKSLSKARSEVERFKSLGYSGFLEDASQNGSTYYRVRVGNFNSLSDAEVFLKKNN